MSNIDKRALREAAEKANADSHTQDEWFHYLRCSAPATVLALLDELEATYSRIGELEVIDTDYGMKFQRAQDALKHQSLLHKSQLEAAEKRIAELEASHSNLREAMAGIHNTITGGGAHTPLAAILNASKSAYEESAAAAGKGV